MVKISMCLNNRTEKTKNNCDACVFGFWEETETICYSVIKIVIMELYINIINPSAWSDGHCPHTVNITCRGVMGTARMLHALTHSSISRQVREQM